MEIPYNRLDPDVLRKVIAEYVTREGTDYGDRVYSLDEKVAAVNRQLEDGLATIVFDAESESCNIVATEKR